MMPAGPFQQEASMTRLFAVLLLCCASGAASAQVLPKLNVEPGCRAAAANAEGAKTSVQVCMDEEKGARAELAKRWSTFPARDRRECVAEVSGFEPSYVELLECVTMAGEARREEKGTKDGLPDVKRDGGPGVKKTKQ
jgi:hypothetical protein